MGTALAAPSRTLRPDDIFFPAMAVLILVIVVTGFGQSYFLAGMIRAKLPNVLVHIHGAIFVTWIFFLLFQTSLVAAQHVKLHMTLGIVGVILPPLMLILGVFTLMDSIRRAQLDIPPELILVGDLENLLLFILLTMWALLARRDPASHKRLMILGTMAILGPAIDRWGFGINVTLAVILALPMLIVVYDLWSRRRILRATAIGYAMIAAAIFTILPVSKLPLWHTWVLWIRRR
jgi:hypothetical protein